MRRFVLLFLFVVVVTAAGAAETGIPEKVAERLEAIIDLEDDNFAGSYRITISSVIQKTNGKGRKESLIEAEFKKSAGQDADPRLLKYIEDGSDITEKKRKEFETEGGGRSNKDDEDDDDQDLANPFGDTADRYRFGVPETRGESVLLSFEPAPGHEKDKDIARGTIVWDRRSLEPRWLEMVAMQPPKPLKELRLRMEFSKLDGDLYVSRLVTDGLAKILLLKRQFHMEMRFDDIRPTPKDDD